MAISISTLAEQYASLDVKSNFVPSYVGVAVNLLRAKHEDLLQQCTLVLFRHRETALITQPPGMTPGLFRPPPVCRDGGAGAEVKCGFQVLELIRAPLLSLALLTCACVAHSLDAVNWSVWDLVPSHMGLTAACMLVRNSELVGHLGSLFLP